MALRAIALGSAYDGEWTGGVTFAQSTSGNFKYVSASFDFSTADGDRVYQVRFVTITDDYIFIRFGFNLQTIPAAGTERVLFGPFRGRTYSVYNDAGTARLRVTDGITTVTSAQAISTATNYEVDVYHKNTAGATNDKVNLNGTEHINTTALVNSASNPNLLIFGQNQGKGVSSPCVYQIWHVAVADSTGSYNNSWPLENMEIGMADLDGDHGAPYNDWESQAGGSDTGTYAGWDDAITGHDSDTTYNTAPAGANQEQVSTIETAANAGVDAVNYIIHAVRVCASTKEMSGVGGLPLGSGILVLDGGTEYKTPGPGSNAASYYAGWYAVYERAPGDAVAWLSGRFNALEAGVYTTTTEVSKYFRCTALAVTIARVAGSEPSAGTAFGVITSNTLVPASWAGGSRRFGAVPSTEVVTVGSGARRWGAVPSDESVPADSDWTT